MKSRDWVFLTYKTPREQIAMTTHLRLRETFRSEVMSINTAIGLRGVGGNDLNILRKRNQGSERIQRSVTRLKAASA
jgi:hypothetical protein